MPSPWTDGHIVAFLSKDVPRFLKALARTVELQEQILTELTLSRSALQKLVKFNEDRSSARAHHEGKDDPD